LIREFNKCIFFLYSSSRLIIIFSFDLVCQIPVAVGMTTYEAVNLYKGRRVIASKGEAGTNWRVYQLVLYCACGIVAGVVGGLLGLGGGFILGPLFLELGIPPQVILKAKTIITHVMHAIVCG
jgi:hypothetical protein